MPDDPKPTEEVTPKEEPKSEGVPVDQVTELVGEFKDMLKTMADRPMPAPAPGEDPAEKRAKMLEKYNAIREAANEKAATGDVAGAMEDLYGFITQEAQQNQVAPENDPTTKSLLNSTKRLARAENKEAFDKWGDEINAAMANASVAERLDPDAWDKAVRTVKANHVDEIIEERLKAEKSKSETETTVMAAGSRGSRDDDDYFSLDDSDLAMAQIFGKDEEGYTEVLKSYKNAQKGRGSMGVSLVPDGPVEKGKF